MRVIITIFLTLTASTFFLCADFKTNNSGNTIPYDIYGDGSIEMKFSPDGVGIGKDPTEKLDVSGNGIFSTNLAIGASGGNSTLEVAGTIGFEPEIVSSNTTLSGNTIVFANTASDNITLTIPSAADMTGRTYMIKQLETTNTLSTNTAVGDNIDNTSGNLTIASNINLVYPYLSIISDGSKWLTLSGSDNITEIAEPVVAAGNAVTNSDNLVLYWKLDETSGTTVTDETTNGWDGVLNGTTFAKSREPSPYHTGSGNSVDFDGGDDWISVAGSSGMLAGTSAFSITCWVKPDAGVGGNLKGFVGKYSKAFGGLEDFHLGMNTTPKFSFRTNKSGSGVIQILGGTPVANQWFHLVGTWDGSKMRLYVNSVLKATSTTTSGARTTSYNFAANALTNDRDLNGALDEVRYYKVALSQADIDAIFAE